MKEIDKLVRAPGPVYRSEPDPKLFAASNPGLNSRSRQAVREMAIGKEVFTLIEDLPVVPGRRGRIDRIFQRGARIHFKVDRGQLAREEQAALPGR